jgi:hypothetical protein
MTESNHFILRIGDGENFENGKKHYMWGIKQKYKSFLRKVKPGDKLWFVVSKSGGKIIAVADFVSQSKRIFGPLLDLSLTDEELGWSCNVGDYDIEIHYTNLYNISSLNLLTGIKGQASIMNYENVKEKIPNVNLLMEYNYIKRYSQVKMELYPSENSTF